MDNKRFGILLQVINILSIITFEKYWKNGIKITFKKKVAETVESFPQEGVTTSNSTPAILLTRVA